MALVPPTSVGGSSTITLANLPLGVGGDPKLITAVHPMLYSGSTTPGAGAGVGVRVVIPVAGTLHDLSVQITTQAGNIDLGIFDTTLTTRNRLYHSGAVACPAAGWNIVGDPALAVAAGDMLDFVVTTDSGVTVFGAATQVSNTGAQLPSGFYVSPLGGSPRLGWFDGALGNVIPATRAEASLGANQKAVAIIARIS